MQFRQLQQQQQYNSGKMSNQSNGSKVSWVIFVGVTTIFIAAVYWLFNASASAEEKAEQSLGRVASVEGDIKAINTSLAAIVKQLDKIEERLAK